MSVYLSEILTLDSDAVRSSKCDENDKMLIAMVQTKFNRTNSMYLFIYPYRNNRNRRENILSSLHVLFSLFNTIVFDTPRKTNPL